MTTISMLKKRWRSSPRKSEQEQAMCPHCGSPMLAPSPPSVREVALGVLCFLVLLASLALLFSVITKCVERYIQDFSVRISWSPSDEFRNY